MTRLTLCSTDVVLSVTREQHGTNEMFYKKRRRSGRSVMMWWKVACSHPMFLTTNNKLSNNPKSTDRHSRTARNIQKTTDERAYSRDCNILGSNLAEGNTSWYYLRVYSNLARFGAGSAKDPALWAYALQGVEWKRRSLQFKHWCSSSVASQQTNQP